jgi:alkaline phosphatase D
LENPHLKYSELTKKGFIMLDVNSTRIQADWFYINTIDAVSSDYAWQKSMYSFTGNSQLANTNTVSIADEKYDVELAPDCPRSEFTTINDLDSPKIIALYPNPVIDELMFHFVHAGQNDLEAEITDLTGRVVMRFSLPKTYPAHSLSVASLLPANYFLRIFDGSGRSGTVPFIKQ